MRLRRVSEGVLEVALGLPVRGEVALRQGLLAGLVRRLGVGQRAGQVGLSVLGLTRAAVTAGPALGLPVAAGTRVPGPLEHGRQRLGPQ